MDNKMNSKLCIICKKYKENLSIEHIIPDAIGGTNTIQCVCKECNDHLGRKVDCLLTEEQFILALRSKFKIKDKSGKFVDLTKRIAFKDDNGNPIVIKKGDGKLYPELYTGNNHPDIQITKKLDNKYNIKFSGSDIKSIFTKIKRECDRQGFPFNETELKQKLLEQAKTNLTFTPLTVDFGGEIGFDKYIPCAIKIAYESAFDMFGEGYLKDVVGENLREYLFSFIYSDNACNAPDVDVQIVSNRLTSEHFVYFLKCGRVIMAIIILFGGIAFSIMVSKNFEKYENITKQIEVKAGLYEISRKSEEQNNEC